MAARTGPSGDRKPKFAFRRHPEVVEAEREAERVQLERDPRALLRRDLRRAAQGLGIDEVRYFVDLYYAWQGFRIAAGHQTRTLAEGEEPHEAVGWSFWRIETFERDVWAMLDEWSDTEPTGMGQWARGIRGIGPVIGCGLLAHIDITRAPTVGHIWRLAGLDPTQKWLGREGATKLVHGMVGARGRPTEAQLVQLAQQAARRLDVLCAGATAAGDGGEITAAALVKFLSRRPWNASLRTLCWKIGESFVKVQRFDDDIYGRHYAARKLREQERNEAGLFAEQAKAKLADNRIGRDTEAYRWYSQGKLPPGHVHARAKRWAVKLFLAHWHGEAYERHYGRPPPLPYPIAHLPGHTHVVERAGIAATPIPVEAPAVSGMYAGG